MTWAPLRSFAITTTILACAALPAAAQDDSSEPGYAVQGTYVGVAPLLGFALDGITFNGETAFQEIDGPQIGILPKLDKKNMLRAVVGFRARPVAIEFSYELSHPGGTFQGLPVSSKFQAFNIDSRWFFNTFGRIQPHIVVGIAFPLLTVFDGVSDGTSIGDARWRATGLNTEVGLTIYANPRAGVSVGYVYRPLWFTTVRGLNDSTFELRPRFRESSANPEVLAFFTFGKRR
jgi:hypothetical protein